MKKKLMTALALVLVVAMSVAGTYAYLTSQDSVTNTFTVGQVAITLDEQDTDNSTPDANRDKANAYHILPGHTYVKDPTVHVNPVSEDSYIFVKVENGITNFEAASSNEQDGYKNIAAQITANGWTALTGVDNVYYKFYTKSTPAPTTATNLVVFSNFKIADNANDVNDWDSISATTTQINVTAYAVQADGFESASAAWTATFGATHAAPGEGA